MSPTQKIAKSNRAKLAAGPKQIVGKRRVPQRASGKRGKQHSLSKKARSGGKKGKAPVGPPPTPPPMEEDEEGEEEPVDGDEMESQDPSHRLPRF